MNKSLILDLVSSAFNSVLVFVQLNYKQNNYKNSVLP